MRQHGPFQCLQGCQLLLLSGYCHRGPQFSGRFHCPDGQVCCNQQDVLAQKALCVKSLAGALYCPEAWLGTKPNQRSPALVGRSWVVSSGIKALRESGGYGRRRTVTRVPLRPRFALYPTFLLEGRHTGLCLDPGARTLLACNLPPGLCPPALPLAGHVTLGKSLTLSMPQFPCL